MSISVTSFGKLPCGCETHLYTLTNAGGAFVKISDFGGIVTEICVPDKNGKLGDVVLGNYDLAGYFPENDGFRGALIGRVGNRICRGKCTVSGQELTLNCNSNGHHLHGGFHGFNEKVWDAVPVEGILEDKLILNYVSADGEENYPGNLKVQVTYTFTDANELKLHYEAVSDRDTLCNLTNHTYFNLDGEDALTIDNLLLQLNADAFTPGDADLIPSGEIRDVTGTPFDLRKPTLLGERLKMTETDPDMKNGGGFDHNFVLNGSGLREGAAVISPATGRVMRMYTDMPCVQLYTANMLGDCVGKCGKPYGKRSALCLETQYAPDSINHKEFPDSILYAGKKYDFTTIYKFEVE